MHSSQQTDKRIAELAAAIGSRDQTATAASVPAVPTEEIVGRVTEVHRRRPGVQFRYAVASATIVLLLTGGVAFATLTPKSGFDRGLQAVADQKRASQNGEDEIEGKESESSESRNEGDADQTPHVASNLGSDPVVRAPIATPVPAPTVPETATTVPSAATTLPSVTTIVPITTATVPAPTTMAPAPTTPTPPAPVIPVPPKTQEELRSVLPTLERVIELDAPLVDSSVHNRRWFSPRNASDELAAVALCDATPQDGRWSAPGEWVQPNASAAISYSGRTNGVIVTAESPSLVFMVLSFDSSHEASTWLNSVQIALEACQRWQSSLSTFERIEINDEGSGPSIWWSSVSSSNPTEWFFAARGAGSFTAVVYIPHDNSGLIDAYRAPLDALLRESLAGLDS